MAIRQRKYIVCIGDECHEHPPPPPPPPPPRPVLPPPSSDHPFSPYLIFMFCGLSVSFSFICYLFFARYRSRQRNRDNVDEAHEDFVNEDVGHVIHHPIWLINTVGLDQSQIESIQVFKYKSDQGLTEGITDCSVCLSEFEDDESLRLLPKCSHAFHVSCIDTWLRSHTNCPLCRAPIINNTSSTTEHTAITIDSDTSEISATEEASGDGSESIVIEVENNGNLVEKSCGVLDETCRGGRANSDLVDRNRVQEEGFVEMRRSVSMDESLASIVHIAVANMNNGRSLTDQLVMSKKRNGSTKCGHKLKGSSSSFRVCGKIVKSYSIGHSSQKDSSNITNKCPHINRSY